MTLFTLAAPSQASPGKPAVDASRSAPNPLFDAAFYAETYHLHLGDADLYAHYIHTGRFKAFKPNKYFDTSWYLAGNRDVRVLGIDPLDHYLEKGAVEGRNPSPAFDGWLYCLLYPDEKASEMNPLLHYTRHGRYEGRVAPPTFLLPVCGGIAKRDTLARVDDECLRAALPLIRQISDWTATLLAQDGRGGIGTAAVDVPICETPTTDVRIVAASPSASTVPAVPVPDAPPVIADDGIQAIRSPRVRRPAAETVIASRVIANRSPRLAKLFAWLFARDIAAAFHAVRVLGDLPPPIEGPVVVLTNHPSWWDAELYHWLATTVFPDRRGFAPVAAADLQRHPVLTRLGAFPIHPGTAAGASSFLATVERILEEPDAVLSLAVEGCFRDVRERPIRPLPGTTVIARRCPDATFIPAAVDYVFWCERRPNVLLRFGEPIPASALAGLSATAINARFAGALETAMEALAEAGQARKPQRFRTLLQGRTDNHVLYDLWGRARALARGHRFQTELRPMQAELPRNLNRQAPTP